MGKTKEKMRNESFWLTLNYLQIYTSKFTKLNFEY